MPTAAQGLLGGLGQDAFGGQGQDQPRQPQQGMYSRTTTTTTPGQQIQSPAQPSISTPQSPLTTGLTELLSGQTGLGTNLQGDPTKRGMSSGVAGGMNIGV